MDRGHRVWTVSCRAPWEEGRRGTWDWMSVGGRPGQVRSWWQGAPLSGSVPAMAGLCRAGPQWALCREKRHAFLAAQVIISSPAKLNFLCGNLVHSP